MVNKGKYWIYGKHKVIPVYNFEEPKGRNKGIQYWLDFILIGAMLSFLWI